MSIEVSDHNCQLRGLITTMYVCPLKDISILSPYYYPSRGQSIVVIYLPKLMFNLAVLDLRIQLINS